MFAAADDVLRRAAGRAGHIFNLGHGVLPNTPLEQVQALAKHVHAFKAKDEHKFKATDEHKFKATDEHKFNATDEHG